MNKNKNHKNEEANKQKINESIDNQSEEINNKQIKEEMAEVDKSADNEKSESKIEEFQKEIADLKDRFLRKAAEFENYKRRTENDQLNILKYAAESFIIKLLPVIDDLERSLKHIDAANDTESLKEGIKLVYNNFIKVLESQGVSKIDAVGKPFDVHFHEALMQKKTHEAEPHTVVEEILPGYIYKDKVIRHSKVVVSESTDDTVEVNNNKEEKNGNNKQGSDKE